MLPRILPKEKFGEFVGFLLKENRVVAPVAQGHQFAFAEIGSAQEAGQIRMDYDVTILPPKKYVFPRHETLLEFSGREPDQAQAHLSAPRTVILGAHPYDLHAIATLDAAMGDDPKDANYLARRAAVRLVGLNIRSYANEHQFMADMGTAEPPEKGYELFLTDLGDRYYVEVGTPAGSHMIQGCQAFQPAEGPDHKARQRYDEEKAQALPKKLPYNVRYLPDLLNASYDSLLWDAVARRCFSCGTCTNVCPTCYCFNVFDRLNLDLTSGDRQRVWDSCQLKVFAEVAGGENFREHRASRVRHRMFRKGKFILERTGKTGCVGCGRCIVHCVAKISILEAFQQIAGESAEVGA